jgi:predicted nucleic acid-binding protein
VTYGPASGGEEWIVDTGPVIVLAKIGQLDLFTRLAGAVLLPSPVVQEIRRGPVMGAARRAVESGWGTVVPVRYIRVAVRAVGLLDPGEQSVLTLGLKRPGARVILDDRQARKAAQTLGLPMTGTVGVILFALRQGLIPAVVPLFQAIRAAGLYVDESLLRQAAGVGETWP